MVKLETAEPIVTSSKEKNVCPSTQFTCRCEIALLEQSRLLLQQVRVTSESACCGQQQPPVVGRLDQQPLDRLQSEGNGLANQLRIVVSCVHIAAGGERVTNGVDREPLHRTAANNRDQQRY